MLRAVSLGELNAGEQKPGGINLDAVFGWAGKQVVRAWRALRNDEMWNTLFSATTELYHGEADQFWELDTERMWEAGWQATAMLFQGEYDDAEGEEEEEE